MDIYLPKGDVLTKRPVIFSITVEPSTREINLAKTALISVVNLQKKGYVAVSVNYRLSNPLLFLTDKKYNSQRFYNVWLTLKLLCDFLSKMPKAQTNIV